MAPVLRRHACIALVAALGFVLPGAVAARADVLSAGVTATPTGQEMAPGFLGASFEYRALHQYTGRDPRAVDPALLGLLAGLAPGQSPVIRIGGDSTDGSWWPIRGQIAQGGVYYPITKGWLRTTQALAADLNAKLILGINLAAGRTAIAAAEGRAFLEGIGRRYIDALEIGNEPDLYAVFPWYKDRRGHIYRARGRSYGLSDYTKQFTQWAHALPGLPLAGPAVSGPSWMGKLGTFIAAEPRLGLVTYHRYPLRACVTDASSPGFPSIPNLLADSASAGLATPMSPFIATAHKHSLPFRVAEMNSASCQGEKGVSDTFASALWALDTMFEFATVGVDGVNFHMLPGSNYELFSVSHSASGAWQAFVHPEYYGLLMFAQAFPPGARLLQSTGAGGTGSPVKVWATQSGDGAVRVTLINKDPAAEHDVQLSVAGATAPGSLETLRAPSITATSGVTLGGQTFGDETTTGTLPGPPATTPVAPVAGTYTVPLPAGSAALLTIGGGGGGGIGLTAKRR
ncbi:MAG: glycosyl hydrolase family 79 C-terminal domain-containing protein [Solirubrobacteraceae bacterium]